MCHGPRHTHMGVILIPCLGQRCDWLESAHDGDPVAHGRLPFIEILATNIASVDDLIAVGNSSLDLDLNAGFDDGSESAGDSSKLKSDIRNIFALDQTQSGSAQPDRIVICGQQVAGEHTVVVYIRLEGDSVVQTLIVGACREAHSIGGIGGEPVMPVEIVECHIRGIGNAREVIPHGRTRLYLMIAGLLDGHAQLGRLIVLTELDDLAGILDLCLHPLAVDLIVRRRGHLSHIVAAQGQRIGSCDTVGVCGDVADDHAGSCLRDLIDSTFQCSAGRCSCDGIGLFRIFPHLDLASDSCILPGNLRAVAALYIDVQPATTRELKPLDGTMR